MICPLHFFKIVLAFYSGIGESISTMKSETKNNQSGKRFVAYFRVSTQKQGESGLGLEAQQKSVADFVRNGAGEIMAEFTEIESGKKSDRIQLAEAIALCRNEGYTLLVAKLDRLARNVHFISSLQHSKVDFLACDNPHATPFLIHILSAVAEHEANMISTRTRQALEACKARGVKLGNPNPDVAKLNAGAVKAKTAFASKMAPIVAEIRSAGCETLQAISDALNRRGFQTRTNKQFFPATVKNLIAAIPS
jgi:DNA invertase Pin-like site-specific DNA recombinase